MRTIYPLPRSGEADPTFQVFDWALEAKRPGIARLPDAMTINGITVQPEFVYYGGDATLTAGAGNGWPARVGTSADLTYNAGGGAAVINDGAPGLGADDDSVRGDGNAYYSAQNNTVGDLATEDFVFEFVLKMDSAGARFAGKRVLANGWYLYTTATHAIKLTLRTGVTSDIALTGGLDSGSWYHVILFGYRSGNCRGYINGVQALQGDISGSSATATVAAPLNLLAQNGSTQYASNIAYAAMWKRSSWMATPDNATVAADRFALLAGTYPQRAKGTAVPTVCDRDFSAYLDKYIGTERRLFLVGDDWMRACHRKDGSAVNVRGMLIEDDAENLHTYSEDLTQADWTKTGCTIGSNTETAPNGEATMDAIIADAGANAQSTVHDVPTLTAASYACSVWVKKGDRDHFFIDDTTIANGECYFNLATGAKGTQQAGVTGYIEDWGTKYHLILVFAGTAAAHTIEYGPCDADNAKTCTGDGSTPSAYAWGFQCELGSYATSYVPTAAAAATRLDDNLTYKADDGNVTNNMIGTVVADVLLAGYDAPGGNVALSISDGGAAADRITLEFAADDTFDINMRATAGGDGDANPAGDVFDGDVHSLRATWKANGLTAYTDSASAQDTSCGVPDELDRIDVGQDRSSANQFRGLLRNLRIYDEVAEP